MDLTFFQLCLFAGAALVFGSLLLGLSLLMQKLLGIGKFRKIKAQGYECGVRQLDDSQVQFDLKYYLFALMFIVFDVEFVFLLPWALHLSAEKKDLHLIQLSTEQIQTLGILTAEAMIFAAILGLGLYYAWKKNALEWD